MSKQSWYRIANKTADESDVYIYDEIGWFGITANDFVQDLQAVAAKTINLHVSSPGGEVFDGIAIYNALKNHSATVNVTIDSLAASIASVIAQAGDKISIAKTASIMIHEPAGMAWGDAATMRKLAEELDMIGDTISEIYSDRAGDTPADWRSRMTDETWYRGQAAVDAGLADEVTGAAKSNAFPARFYNVLNKYKHVPDDLKPRDAGRTMSQSNLDKLHSSMEGLRSVHDGTCDMGDDCPMYEGDSDSANESPTGALPEPVSITTRLRASIEAAKEAIHA